MCFIYQGIINMDKHILPAALDDYPNRTTSRNNVKMTLK